MTDDPNKPPQTGAPGPRSESDDVNVREIHASILREKNDPHDGYEPVPLWLVSIFMAIVFWAGTYLAFHSGGFKSTVFNPAQVAWGAPAAAPVAKGPPDPMVLGKRVFTANCVACHQATGQGVPNAFPPLAGSEWVLGNDWHGDNHLVRILLHGLQGPIQVKGNTYNGAMPAWNQLKDEEIAAVLTYIRNEWGNKAPPITAERVSKIRAETASQTTPNTQEALKALPAEKFEAPASAPAPGNSVPAPSPAPAGAPTGTPIAPAPATTPAPTSAPQV